MTARIQRPAVALFLAAAALTLAGCGGGATATDNGAGSDATGKIRVAASTNVWGSVVQAVGGDAVAVSAVIDSPQKDPHGYDFTAQDVTKVTGAKFAIYNGQGYDQKFEDTLKQAGGKITVLNAFAVSGKPASDTTNEHVFYDLATVKKVADETAKDLGEIQPARKDTFTQNSKDFDAKIDGMLTRVKQVGAEHPGKKALVTEPVADYLLATAGVADATPKDFAQAVEKDSDIPPAAQAETNALLSSRQVSALVNNAQTETPVTKQLKQNAAAAGIPVVDVTETFPTGTNDYLSWMGRNIDGLTAALSK